MAQSSIVKGIHSVFHKLLKCSFVICFMLIWFFPELTKSKNLISRTPVSPAELLSLIIILGFFKDIDFSFFDHFFFFWGKWLCPWSISHYAWGKKASQITKGHLCFTYLEEVRVSWVCQCPRGWGSTCPAETDLWAG